MKYPRTRPGQLSAYYAALSLEKLDKTDDARKWLKGLADGDSDFASLAKFELAQLNDRVGQGDEAVKLYQQLIAKPAVLVPKPVVMLALAEHYSAEKSRRSGETLRADQERLSRHSDRRTGRSGTGVAAGKVLSAPYLN